MHKNLFINSIMNTTIKTTTRLEGMEPIENPSNLALGKEVTSFKQTKTLSTQLNNISENFKNLDPQTQQVENLKSLRSETCQLQPIVGEYLSNYLAREFSEMIIFTPQGGINVNHIHSVDWKAGDRVLNGLSNAVSRLTSFGKQDKENSKDTESVDDFQTVMGEDIESKLNIFSFFGNTTLHVSILVLTIFMYHHKKTRLTTSLYFIFLSLYILRNMQREHDIKGLVLLQFLPLWEAIS